jgi:sulfotransferase
MKTFHFISGLPRSGSTLLAAILSQNPRFVAGISSPAAPIFMMMQQLLSAKQEYHALLNDDKRRSLLRGVLDNYYWDIADDKLVFDTNRTWSSKLDVLVELFPGAKLICCVRSLAWIADSFERLFRKNKLEPSALVNFEPGGSVYTRIEMLNNPLMGPIGLPFGGLREAFYGELSDRLILITYETLTREPRRAIEALYRHIGEPPFDHNFETVASAPSEDYDAHLGTPGLHRVAPKVQAVPRATILPPDVFQRFETAAFWMDPRQNPRKVVVI